MLNFSPRDALTDEEIDRGLKLTLRDGVTTQIMVTATEGIFLVSFALLLGASNLVIGIIAALPFLSQISQIMGISILEKLQVRRKIVVISVFVSRIFLLLIALIPLVFSDSIQIILLAVFIFFRNLTGAVAGVSWNSWMKDLIPSSQLGTFFGKRMRLASIVGTILLVIFSLFLDFWQSINPDMEIIGYSILFSLGFLAGMIGTYFLYSTPEPKMKISAPRSIKELFSRAFGDGEFRPLLIFLFIWNFAINLAAPFFTVYMITQLSLPIFQITLFLIITQIFNILFLRFWGGFADRFSYKSTLLVCAPLFILTFPIWVFTTSPGIYVLTYPLLIIIHVIQGITISGINLSIGTIVMKISPDDASSSYLASAGVTNSIAAGVGTILGGTLADYFSDKTLIISLQWISDTRNTSFSTLNLQQWDFVFLIAAFIGIIALERLTHVKESGSISRKEALNEVLNAVRVETRRYSPIAGLSKFTQISILPLRERRNNRKKVKSNNKDQSKSDHIDN